MEHSLNYLPGWLQRAMSAPYPTRVNFPDFGYVSVFPSEGRYHSNIEDWAAPSVLRSDEAEFTPLPDSAPAQAGPLIDLHWSLLLQRLAQLNRQAQDYPFQFSVVRLVSWPSLTHMPQDVLPAVARLCALLARKPSTASLLPLLLELPETQVFMLIEALRLNGHVQVASTAAETEQGAEAPMGSAEAVQPVQPATQSFITKVWQRLVASV